MHKIISDHIHLDIFIMKPTEDEPFYILYTSGMNALPLTISNNNMTEKYKNKLLRAKLMLFLPADRKMGQVFANEDTDNNDYYPIYMLITIARFPNMEHGLAPMAIP